MPELLQLPALRCDGGWVPPVSRDQLDQFDQGKAWSPFPFMNFHALGPQILSV